ncbi:MurR/RpiR family transcriptional regulator [Lacticaseibacillus nasuensis]|uniref:MurR/RpiR family transcriptional regulator n=1 Tax=Lacticaseibacillus nasuensis TaxID=944671 RepID=UPI0022464537|nr:MurR/RpiR family transcriptional regulator [Lacticaseibacillus nasuensis]MCX2455269.1 MurR/RpiR family transcriptional regulator [Lacticaseibacillus nasuensis]
MSVEGNILSARAELSEAEDRLATYVLAHPDLVLGMNVKQLAKAAGTSPSTVSRFARRVQFPGYNELKLQLSFDRNNPSTAVTIDPEIKANETLSNIEAKLLQNADRSLHETVEAVQPDELAKLLRWLKRAEQVVCFGMSASYLVAQDIVQKWSRLGVNCLATDDLNQLLPLAAARDGEKKLFWFVSNSGETPEVLIGSRLVQEAGGKVVALTTLGANSLSRRADIVMTTSAPLEANVRFAATQSLHAQLMLVDIIYYAYVSRNYPQAKGAIVASRQIVDDYKNVFRAGFRGRH